PRGVRRGAGPGPAPHRAQGDRRGPPPHRRGLSRGRGPTTERRNRERSGSHPPMAMKVALLGCGVVGAEVVRLLQEQADELAARIGTPVEVGGIAVRRLGRARGAGLDPELFTTDAMALVPRPDIDLVVEVIGGIEPARSLILAAIKNGKSVVTANKALLAEDGAAIHDAAREAG